jgi:hypothetical protein
VAEILGIDVLESIERGMTIPHIVVVEAMLMFVIVSCMVFNIAMEIGRHSDRAL